MAARTRPPMIAVCGASAATESQEQAAEAAGRLLAERGAVVVCGGLTGVMEAVARGCAAAGGTSIGLLPGDDPGAANPHIGTVIATGLGEIRNALIARSTLGMVAIGGGYGTLSEIGFMLRLGRPVTCVDSWGVSPPGESTPEPAIHRAADAAEAVGWLWERLKL